MIKLFTFKFCLFPLSIAWLNSRFKITEWGDVFYAHSGRELETNKQMISTRGGWKLHISTTTGNLQHWVG